MSEHRIAQLVLEMSDEEQGILAAGMCSNLDGYSFERIESDEPLNEEHVLKSLREWAADELRHGDLT